MNIQMPIYQVMWTHIAHIDMGDSVRWGVERQIWQLLDSPDMQVKHLVWRMIETEIRNSTITLRT